MSRKFLVLYLTAGTLALLLVIYQIINTYPSLNAGRIVLNAVICLFLYYMAYKVYHEKRDNELM